MKSLIKAIAVGLLLRGSPTEADVIYLTNGNVLVVEKVWEEGVEVRYQTGGIVQILQKSSVKRIQAQKAVPAHPKAPLLDMASPLMVALLRRLRHQHHPVPQSCGAALQPFRRNR